MSFDKIFDLTAGVYFDFYNYFKISLGVGAMRFHSGCSVIFFNSVAFSAVNIREHYVRMSLLLYCCQLSDLFLML